MNNNDGGDPGSNVVYKAVTEIEEDEFEPAEVIGEAGQGLGGDHTMPGARVSEREMLSAMMSEGTARAREWAAGLKQATKADQLEYWANQAKDDFTEGTLHGDFSQSDSIANQAGRIAPQFTASVATLIP